MRILVVHNRYRSSSPSGEDRVVDQEHEALAAAGHCVERVERSSDEIAVLTLREQALVPARVVWSRRALEDLDRSVARFGPDVVHLHNLFPLISPSALRSCERSRIPCVVTFHNYRQVCASGFLFRTGAICRRCVGRRFELPGIVHGCYRGSALATLPIAVSTTAHRRSWQRVPSAYLFLSEAHRRELASLGLPPHRCFVKDNLVPPAGRRQGPEGLVVFLGRLEEAKGIRVLMSAWDRLTQAGRAPSLRLVVAGSGPLEAEVRRWARPRSSVEVVGLLGHTECADLVRRASAVVVPSEWLEPFGLVVAEAMAAGVAPLAPALGAFPELIADGVDGLLYPPGDAQALAGLLARVGSSPRWMDRLGVAARRTYERRFAPAVVVARLEAIYRFAIAHPRWLEPRRVEADRCSWVPVSPDPPVAAPSGLSTEPCVP